MNPVLLEDFCNFKYLSNIAFSPEGKSACFVITESDLEKNDYKSNIYLREDGSVKKLTSGNKEGSFFYYDENTVMFTGNRDDSKEKSSGCKVYKIALDAGFTCPNRDGKIGTGGCIFCSKGFQPGNSSRCQMATCW